MGPLVMVDSITLYPFTNLSSGQTMYVNPSHVRYILRAGQRTVLVFSETHVVTVTADFQSVVSSGIFAIATVAQSPG